MGTYLQNVVSGAVTTLLDEQSPEYEALIQQIATEDITISGTDVLRAGNPIWEPTTEDESRASLRAAVAVLNNADPTSLTADVHAMVSPGLDEDIVLTSASYTPYSDITGVVTNNRTVSVVAGEQEASPTTVADVTFGAGTNGVAGEPVALTVVSGAVPAGVGLTVSSIHNGSGLDEPGGVVLVEYTTANRL